MVDLLPMARNQTTPRRDRRLPLTPAQRRNRDTPHHAPTEHPPYTREKFSKKSSSTTRTAPNTSSPSASASPPPHQRHRRRQARDFRRHRPPARTLLRQRPTLLVQPPKPIPPRKRHGTLGHRTRTRRAHVRRTPPATTATHPRREPRIIDQVSSPGVAESPGGPLDHAGIAHPPPPARCATM